MIRRGAAFFGLACALISPMVLDLSSNVSEWLQTDNECIGFDALFNYTGLPRYGLKIHHFGLAILINSYFDESFSYS